MGIFDKLKDVKIDKVVDTASTIGGLFSSDKKDDKIDKILGAASAIGGLLSSTKENVGNQNDKLEMGCVNVVSASTDLMVSPIQDMRNMLFDMQVNAPRPIAMVLKAQIEILSFVQSPTIPRMVIDNIISYIHNALKVNNEEEQREILQESFVDLLQCFIYVMEACLRYEISQNKEVSVKLLTEAGNLLVDSVSMIVKMTAHGNVSKIENVLVSNYELESFFGSLAYVSGNNQIEEKIKEFYKTLEYLYYTLDKYADVIGTSVQLHGMLKRYADDMVDKYTMAQYDSILKQIKKQETEDKANNKGEDELLEKGIELISTCAFDQTKLISVGAGLVSNMINKETKSNAESEQESVQDIKRNLESQLKEYETRLARHDTDIAQMNDELKSLSIFRQSRKSELQMEIEIAKEERKQIAESVASCSKKLNLITDILKEVEKYSSNIYRIVKKFE